MKKGNIKMPKRINYSKKLQEIYFNKNKYDLSETIKRDIKSNFSSRYVKNNILYIETIDEVVYEFKQNELSNIFSKKEIDNEKIIESLLINPIQISQNVITLFNGIPIKKINEILINFLKNSAINKKEKGIVYLENKIEEVVLVIDYHNLYLEDILNYDLSSIDKNDFLVLEKDKIKVKSKNMKDIKDIEILKKQLIYLDSYSYDLSFFKNDIYKNLQDYNLTSNDVIVLYTNDYIYNVLDYNIVSIKNNYNIPMPTKTNNSKKNIDLENLNIDFDIDKSLICSNSVKQVYGNYIKAIEYIEKLGLSIRVLTKFITNKNFKELFRFIISDIVYYGSYVYENYTNNTSIILTNRFVYILRENIIIDIKTISCEDIEECSLDFKPVIKKVNKKNTILDLDIKDKIRNYITYETISSLKIVKHAHKRFNERISKNDDFEIKEDIFKNDIYKYGEVMLGTYYLNSKLIRGKKFVYVITNEEIISIWKINDFIDSIGLRYFDKIKNS